MSKGTASGDSAHGASKVSDWMAILHLDKAGFKILSKKVNLQFDPAFPIADPVQRLIVTLRFLVTGEGYHDSLQTMFMQTFEEMSEALNDEKIPISIRWEIIARDFQIKWALPNCLGAVVAKRIPVEVVPEFKWLYQNCKRPNSEAYFLFTHFYNANYRFVGGLSIAFPGLFDDDETISRILDISNSNYPAPRTPPGSTHALPYSFIGSDNLKASKWMRVPSSAKNDNDKRAIEQGLRPAAKAFHLIQSRFGILRGTLPIPRCGFEKHLNRVIGLLHNFFMDNNPEYAGDLDLFLTKDEVLPPINVSIPRYAIDVDREWMDKLHMDEGMFQCLLKMTMPSLLKFDTTQTRPDVRLRAGLRYMATAKGYDPTIEVVLKDPMLAFKDSLAEYDGVLPLPEKKWMKIAAGFDQKMDLPNCVGVIYPQVLLMPDCLCGSSFGFRVLVLDAFGRISYSGPIIKFEETIAMDCIVDRLLKKNLLGLPTTREGGRRFMFIGYPSEHANSLMATPDRPGHFSQAQISRALELPHTVDTVLKERFAFIGREVKVPGAPGFDLMMNTWDEGSGGMSDARAKGLLFALGKMHNFLMDKSPTYGDVFKDLHN